MLGLDYAWLISWHEDRESLPEHGVGAFTISSFLKIDEEKRKNCLVGNNSGNKNPEDSFTN